MRYTNRHFTYLLTYLLTWLRAVEADLGQQNIGLASAWRKAAIRDDWRRIVDTAMLQRSML